MIEKSIKDSISSGINHDSKQIGFARVVTDKAILMQKEVIKIVKAVLFDLDGTLLDRNLSVHNFIKEQYERLNMSLGHIPKDRFTTKFTELDCRGYVWKDKVYRKLVDEFEIKELTWEFLLKDYLTHFKNSCIPFSNLNSMLEELKHYNIALGMITNGKGKFQTDNIKSLGIEQYFDTILVSETEGLKKPDARIFEKALKNLDVSANEGVFVGDHPENDVKAAKNVGMIGIWKKDDHWGHAEADYIIDDLSELPLIIGDLVTRRRKFHLD